MEIKEISSSKYKLPSESERAKAKDKIEKMRKEGEKLVKGMFEFLDAQGGWLDFSYRFFPGDPIRTVHITHGEIVDMPMCLVKHLNNVYKKVRIHDDISINQAPQDTGGKVAFKTPTTKYSRTRFTPTDVL
jgi:hypothetical protein